MVVGSLLLLYFTTMFSLLFCDTCYPACMCTGILHCDDIIILLCNFSWDICLSGELESVLSVTVLHHMVASWSFSWPSLLVHEDSLPRKTAVAD